MVGFIDVYVRKFPFPVENEIVYPKERQIQIDACKNEKVKAEKFYAWKLLEYAFLQCFSIPITQAVFKKDGGRWTCDKGAFSLSHSHDIVAVAISQNAVGVDVEKVNLERFSALSNEKTFTKEELAFYTATLLSDSAHLKNKLWTVKEALFKQKGGKIFRPEKIQTLGTQYATYRLKTSVEEFFLSVVGTTNEKIRIHAADGIEITPYNG